MACQSPGNSAIFQLLCTYFACEGAVGLIENILGGNLDALAEGLSGNQEVDSRWSDDDLYPMILVSPLVLSTMGMTVQTSHEHCRIVGSALGNIQYTGLGI